MHFFYNILKICWKGGIVAKMNRKAFIDPTIEKYVYASIDVLKYDGYKSFIILYSDLI